MADSRIAAVQNFVAWGYSTHGNVWVGRLTGLFEWTGISSHISGLN